MNDDIVFYHIPRTGGRWAIAAMRNARVRGLRRARPKGQLKPLGLRREHGVPADLEAEKRKDKFEFCFVRRPAAWYRSFHAYRARSKRIASSPECPPKWRGRWRDMGFPLDHLWEDDLDAFAENVLKKYPHGFFTAIIQAFVGPDNTEMNFVGRQEGLPGDLIKALTLAGVGFNEARLLATPRKNAAPGPPIDSGLAEKLNQADHWVLETFYAA